MSPQRGHVPDDLMLPGEREWEEQLRRDGWGDTATKVVTLRLERGDHRALREAAIRDGVSPAVLLRRWVRAGLAQDLEHDPAQVSGLQESARVAADRLLDRLDHDLLALSELLGHPRVAAGPAAGTRAGQLGTGPP